MSNIPISSLPVAIALDGSELVPIVQGGTTKRTTAAAIAASAGGLIGSTLVITTAGTHAVDVGVSTVLVNKSVASPTTLVISSISLRGGLPLSIADITGLGGDITLVPNGTDTFMGNATWIIGSGGVAGSGGSAIFYPSAAVTPNVWYL